MNHLASNVRHGIVEERETYEERDVIWKITNISSVMNGDKICYTSPCFSFAHNSWYFKLFIGNFSESMNLYLMNQYRNEYSVEYSYGVQKVDGTVEHFGRGNFEQGNERSDPCIMNFSSFEQRKSELIISDVLTVTCILKLGTLRFPQPNVLDRPNSKKLRNLDGLSQNFKDLFADKESCDTTLLVKAKEFKVHKAVLMARSSVFSAMFHDDMSEKQTGIVTIPDCDPESFQEFLEYLYCGQLKDMSFSSAFHLYSTSDKYDVQDLKAFCVEYLTQSLTHENVCEFVIMAHKYDDSKLTSATQDFFNRNIHKIVYTAEWECLLRDNYHLANKLLKGMSSKV